MYRVILLLVAVFVLSACLPGCRSKVGALPGDAEYAGKADPGENADSAEPPVLSGDDIIRFEITSVEINPTDESEGSTAWGELITGREAEMVISWTGGASPYRVEIEPGYFMYDYPVIDVDGSPVTCELALPSSGDYDWVVKVTDAYGRYTYLWGNYLVWPLPGENAPPVIQAVSYDPTLGLLIVDVADDDTGDLVTVEVSEPAGFTVDYPLRTCEAWSSEARFQWYPADPDGDPVGVTDITVHDRWEPELTVSATQALSFDLTRDPQLMLSAIPLENVARVGDTVTVVVSSGFFPARAPFAYLNGVAVTVEAGGEYVDGTFNIGSPGGETEDIDGIWAKLNPPPVDFFIPEDFMMKAATVDGDDALVYFGFNVTPISSEFLHGGQTTSGGDLFNFGITFAEPGTYHLGFLEFQDVNRTYYSTTDAVEYFWNDLDNLTGNPMHIRVLE